MSRVLKAIAAVLATLVLWVMVGCASTSYGLSEEDEQEIRETYPNLFLEECRPEGIVKLHVINEHSADIRTNLAQRAFRGFSRDSIMVPRSWLRSAIRLEIARGGFQRESPPPVLTEPLYCNDASLLIGSSLNQSYFCGRTPERCAWGRRGRR